MEYLSVTPAELSDILSVFQERGVELLYSVQDTKIRIYTHFEEIEDILWAARVVDGLEAIFSPKMAMDSVIARGKADSGVMVSGVDNLHSGHK